MKLRQLTEFGRIVKGVNTTADVDTNSISREAGKFGNKVDKDGRPPTLSKKVKGSKTNVLFNLGMAENKKLDEKWSDKYKRSINCSNPKGFSQKAHCAGRKKNEGAEITMWTNPEYQGADVDDKYYEKQPVKRVDISKLTPFEPADKMDPKDNHDNMMKFVDKIKAGKKIKPIVIVPHEDKWLIVDGHHRYFAHLKAGEDKIRAVIADPKDLTWRDDVPESVTEAQELSSVSTIYVDMDGVLADFFGAWAKLMKKDHWTKIDDIMPALQKIRDTENFWLDLPLTSNAKNLLMLIKDIKGEYNILSSPLPDDPNSEPHKREWIKKNLDFFPPKDVIITHDKARYATTEDGTPNILIDDYGINIQKWEAAGGVGFKHKDHKFERTAKAIKQHMQEPVESYTREQLPQIRQKNLKNIRHTMEWVRVEDLIPVQEERILENFKRQVNRIVAGKYNPIIVDCDNKIVNGHHRYEAAKLMGYNEMAVAKLPFTIKQIVENFADGKKKGKSRPGRVKRSGASCKGSVSELRRKAKKYSGERAKMYHWCANMKSGRNK